MTDQEILQKHVDALMEHFDSIQIFGTRHEQEAGTVNSHAGDGNLFARFGQAVMFVEMEKKRFTE